MHVYIQLWYYDFIYRIVFWTIIFDEKYMQILKYF